MCFRYKNIPTFIVNYGSGDYMSYDLEFLDDECGVITEYHGALTSEIIRKCTIERYASKERNENLKYILNDYTELISFDITSEDVITVAKMAVNVSKINKDIVIVGIMPTDLEFGMGRMWQAYADETGWNSLVVRSRSEGEAWIEKQIGNKLQFNHTLKDIIT